MFNYNVVSHYYSYFKHNMDPPKTNGGNFFVGAGDASVISKTQKTIPTALTFQFDTMATDSSTNQFF